MNNYFEFPDTPHIYGYCACPISLVDEHVTASQSHRYYITVIQDDCCGSIMENCVWLVTYVFYLDELVAFIRRSDGQILSIQRYTDDI